MDNLVGQILKSYSLSELIDMGGFGSVYRAHQAVVEREVAVKIIYPAFANRPAFIRRFETEAQLIASLEHPHIVPLYDYWRDPNGAYIVMRWLRGGHLRKRMEKPLEVQDVLPLLQQVSSALAFAHRHGVVHRDLKPENILMDEEGNVYLADFGIAQIVTSTDEDDEMMSSGSPAYASPEQINNTQTTLATDIYSLGVILYELLAGEHPFPDLDEKSGTELIALRQTHRLPSILKVQPELPAGVDDVIQKATALDPSERYRDVPEFINAFRSAISLQQTLIATDTSEEFIPTEDIPNPYKGLRAFQEADTLNFFGRRVLVTKLLRRMSETGGFTRFLAVVGPSGSGKSSVVKAGLMPALRRGAMPNSDRWYYIEMVPGNDPFEELETALVGISVDPPSNMRQRLKSSGFGLLDVSQQILAQEDRSVELFIFIDQFEEVFTMAESEEAIELFLENLYTAINSPESRLRIVITLRADFYDRPLLRPLVSDLMSRRTEVVIPMTPEELEEAIIKPAQRVGVVLETGLNEAIINEVKGQMGALPLLQYLMAELFSTRLGMKMTLEAYRQMGGVRGALARRADDLFESLDASQQDITRQIFLRLVTLGEGTEDTRRRALLAELTSIMGGADAVRMVIDVLGKSRMLTFDRDPVTRSPTVEIAHEAIIREWRRLRTWLDISRTDVRMQRTLAALANEWINAGRDASYLLRGIRLEQYEQWQQETSVALTHEERNLLDASLRHRVALEEAEKRRQEREEQLESRSRNRLRLLVAVLTVAAVIAFGLAGVALNESRRAQQESEISSSLAYEASARRALSDGDGDLAVVLALESNNIERPSEQAFRTLTEVAFSPGTRRVFTGHTSGVLSVDLSTDGTKVVSGSFDGTVRLWDSETGQLIGEPLTGHSGDVFNVEFSPDGRYIVSTDVSRVNLLWDVSTQQQVRTLGGNASYLRSLVFTPDSTRLIGGADDTEIYIWDIETGELLPTVPFPQKTSARISALAITADATILLGGSNNGTFYAWDLTTNTLLYDSRTLAAAQPENEPSETSWRNISEIHEISINADSTQALLLVGNDNLLVVDIATGTILRRFIYTGVVVTAAFVPSEPEEILLGTQLGNLELWNIYSGLPLNQMRGHTNAISKLVIDEGGTTAVTGSLDDTVRLWQISNPTRVARFQAHETRVNDLEFTTDTASYFTVSNDGYVRQWNTATNVLETEQLLDDTVAGIEMAVHPTNNQLLIGLRSGQIMKWDPTDNTMTPLFDQTQAAQATATTDETLPGIPTSAINALAINPAGTQFAFGEQDNAVLFLRDYETNEEIRRFEGGHTRYVRDAVFSSDGTRILSGSLDGSLILWDVATGEIVQQLTHTAADQESEDQAPIAIWSVDISPNGQLALSGSAEDVILWNLQTGTVQSRFIEHTDQIQSVRFRRNGAQFLSASIDGSVILWDIATARELQRFVTLDGAYAANFSPDDQFVLAGEESGMLEMWRLYALPDLLTWTRSHRYIATLTCTEQRLYRINSGC